MILFEFLCITSWIGSFLSSSENLLPSKAANVLPVWPAKVSTQIGKLVNKHRPLFVRPKQPMKVWSTTLLPSRFLKIDWGNNKPKRNLNKPLNSQARAVKNSQNQFCTFGEDLVAKQSGIGAASLSLSGSIINANPEQRDLFPHKFLRSLQDFFRFAHPVEQNFMSASLPVLIVQRQPNNYEVWLNQHLVATLPTEPAAKSLQKRLTKLAKSTNFDANQLRPALVDGLPALMAGNRFLWRIENSIARQFQQNADLLAIEWINNLRSAFKASTLTLVEGQKQMYGVTPTSTKLSGLASWYGGYFHGRLTANGEIYNKNELTVAHKSLPFNTYLQVTNLQNNQSVIVRVNDRGPYIPPRSLDLSQAAARCLGSEMAGVVPYKAVILQNSEPKITLKPSTLTTFNSMKPKPVKQLAFIPEF
ncbi:septal ring lytic transglycosylase RlpA family protein [Calothrix anomala FACHB-343]|uniref:Probable endolytic peptidoglycan transglycosylase RlpA n=2 Tax=Calothrix TaxID=1186 RepID=A0ABR8A4R4_9CYAN|nr:septal ring lytic transglycosylase RlpA family protein [Calothrix parietina FACHB-288]MBD2223167.1 septal ring lytic transglycosylase RlpA family protein [Calothrix anomala FACHB-343]